MGAFSDSDSLYGSSVGHGGVSRGRTSAMTEEDRQDWIKKDAAMCRNCLTNTVERHGKSDGRKRSPKTLTIDGVVVSESWPSVTIAGQTDPLAMDVTWPLLQSLLRDGLLSELDRSCIDRIASRRACDYRW